MRHLTEQCSDCQNHIIGMHATPDLTISRPQAVRRRFGRLHTERGERAGATPLHDTRGLGLANGLAAWEAGARTFDRSHRSRDGCAYAAGASVNVLTEDLVFRFEAMGKSTGIDLGALIAVRAVRAVLRAGRSPVTEAAA